MIKSILICNKQLVSIIYFFVHNDYKALLLKLILCLEIYVRVNM